jgi:excinuclease UvrABC nuclease subunit
MEFKDLDRETLIKKIEKIIEKEPIFDVEKNFICNNYKESKNGIYFLYNEKDIVIYVGKAGNGDKTSFAHRMYLHGDGAHCKKNWFGKVKKFRFKSFTNLNSKEISKVERLMIYAKNQPAFNDCYTTENEYELIESKL